MLTKNTPNGWVSHTLADVLTKIVGGGTPSKKEPDYWGGKIPWASVKDFTSAILGETKDYITPEGLKHSSSNLIDAGTIIIPTRMGLGRVAICDKDIAINQDLKALYHNELIERDYLYHWLISKASEIESLGTGSTVLGIKLDTLKKIPIKLPSRKSEQKKVADILSTVDKKINLIDEEIIHTKKLKKGLMQKLFSEGINNVEGWVKGTIGDYITFSGGAQPPRSEFINEYKNGYIRLIQIRDYKSDKYLTYIPKDKARKFCSKKDVMIGRYGPPIFQILRGIEGAYNVALLKAIPSQKLNREYMYHFLQQDCLLSYIESFSQRTSGQTGIEMDRLKEYPLYLPTMEAQIEIVEILDNVDMKIELLTKQKVASMKLKKGLMQKLLTGEWRVNSDSSMK